MATKKRHRRVLIIGLLVGSISFSPVAPVEAETGEPLFTFVQITDTHMIAGKSTENVEKAVDDITLLEPQPQFVVTTGDLINGEKSAASLELYKEVFSRLNCPSFAVYGNHDGSRQDYQNKIGKFNYAFDLAPYHFIVLDSIDKSCKETYGTSFSERTLSWLEKHLQQIQKEVLIIVFSHGAPYRPDSYADDLPGDVENYEPVLDLLDPYNVVAWFAGHSHTNSRVSRKGVEYFSTGCVSDERKNKNVPPGYRVVRVWKDHVETTFRTLDHFRNIIRVGKTDKADFQGDTHQPIRKAVDAASRGDVVHIENGTYAMKDGIQLKSGITIAGSGDTVLQLPPPTRTDAAEEGSNSLGVASDPPFVQGDHVEIRPPSGDKTFPASDKEHVMVRIKLKENADLQLADPLSVTVPKDSKLGYKHNMFTTRGRAAEDITLRNLTLDGGRVEDIPQMHGHMSRCALAVAGKYSYSGGPVKGEAVRNVRIRNCRIQNCYGRAVAMYYVLNGEVKGCIIENIDDEAIDFDHFTRNCRATGNVVKNARTGVTINDGSYCTVEYNRIVGCDTGVKMWWWHKCPQKNINIRNRIRHNLVLGDKNRKAITLGRRCKWNKIVGNTVKGDITIEEEDYNHLENNRQK